MAETDELIVFQDKNIKRKWFNEEWWFVATDIIAALIDSENPSGYLKDMRRRDEGFAEGWGQIATPLKIKTKGGFQNINCVSTKGAFRLIQSIPSKKVEPFKMWLAQVGSERIDELQDPELSIDRAMKTYLQKGYSKDWIGQRLKTIEVRKQLTNEWHRVGLEKQEDFAILTNEITNAWSGKTIQEYTQFKGLKKENLRDNMSNLELVLNMLAEATTKEFSEKENPGTFDESRTIAEKGGTVAGNTRRDIENQLGESIITSKNAKQINSKLTKKSLISK